MPKLGESFAEGRPEPDDVRGVAMDFCRHVRLGDHSSPSINLAPVERDCAQLGLRAGFPSTISKARRDCGDLGPNRPTPFGVKLEIYGAFRHQAEQSKSP